jgi:hypothetical protein
VASGSSELGREGENATANSMAGKRPRIRGREGRTAEGRSRAGRSNSSEESWPRERAIDRVRAQTSSSRGGGTPWAKGRALDEVGMAGHRAGAASRCGHTAARPNWLKADANKVKQARGRESHLGAELGEAWRGLRRAGWSGTWERVSVGGWWRGQSTREGGAARNEAGGGGGG